MSLCFTVYLDLTYHNLLLVTHINTISFLFLTLAVACPTLYPPINGILILPCVERFQSQCIVECIDGFSLRGSGIMECEIKNGITNWNFEENTCEGNYCTPIFVCAMTSYLDRTSHTFVTITLIWF